MVPVPPVIVFVWSRAIVLWRRLYSLASTKFKLELT